MLDTVPAMLKPPHDSLVWTVRQLITVLLVMLQLLLWHWSRPTHQSSRVTSSRSSPMPRSWPRRWWIVATLLCQVKNKVLWHLCSRSYFFPGEWPSATVLVKFDSTSILEKWYFTSILVKFASTLPLCQRNGTLPLYWWNLHLCWWNCTLLLCQRNGTLPLYWWNWTLNSVLVKLCSTSVLGKLYSTYVLVKLYSACTLVKWHSTVKVAAARKRSRSFCQQCWWHVTAKHAYTLRMWLCMKWHGTWLYGVHRPRRDGISFLWPCQCKYTTSVDIPSNAKRAIKS